MNRRTAVLGIAALGVAGFATLTYLYERVRSSASVADSSALVRPHSPVIGPGKARVTIVEFFDPSCEACRAFHPIVKNILAQHPNDVRLVLRYAPFHQGSEEAVRILETARLQNVFEPVLEALFAKQPEWADHSGPRLDKAWIAAASAGLNVTKAKEVMLAPHITETLKQDVADGKAVGIRATPTFLVNGKPLPSFGPQQLYETIRFELLTSPR